MGLGSPDRAGGNIDPRLHDLGLDGLVACEADPVFESHLSDHRIMDVRTIESEVRPHQLWSVALNPHLPWGLLCV